MRKQKTPSALDKLCSSHVFLQCSFAAKLSVLQQVPDAKEKGAPCHKFSRQAIPLAYHPEGHKYHRLYIVLFLIMASYHILSCFLCLLV